MSDRPDITLTRQHALKRALELIGCTNVKIDSWGISGDCPPPRPPDRVFFSGWTDLRDHGWGDGMGMTTEQSAVEVEIFKLRMDKTLGRIIDRERSALREARELEAEESEARDWRSNVERPEV